ncbi:Zinc finger protein 593 [Scophthalmus maximus]|uniref:Zinc finger protein 593 n=2 Tax=Scophthalmus maximus TaxID=52904 RepID=A0A2U9CIJ8_SCOMX|nr:Zinc finger protein 593 [Scophthalmus maximus]
MWESPPVGELVYVTLGLTRKYIHLSRTRVEGSKMGKSKQTGNHKSDKKKNIAKTWKTKRRTKDLDQIHSDLKPETAAKLLQQDVDYDVTGGAQNYCLHCARYFVDLRSLKEHFKTKVHKRRLKQLREEPYTQAEADRAAGMGSYIAPKTVEVKTQSVEEDMH